MAAEESINEFVSQQALKQLDDLKAKIDAAAKAMEGLIVDTEGFNKEIAGATNLKEYTLAVDKSKSSVTALEAATQKLEFAQTEEAKQLALLNAQLAAVNKANRDAAKSALEQESAYNKLNKEYKEAAQRAKDLAAANSKGAKAAAAEAAALGQRLKDIDASVGQFNRNVGNYAGGIKDALSNNIPIVGQLRNAFNDVGGAVQGLSGSFGKLGASIAATGIGLFLLALGGIVAYVKELDPFMDELEASTAGAGAAFREMGGTFTDLIQGKTSIIGFWDTLSKRMRQAGSDARIFTKLQQDLDDKFRIQQFKSADAEQQVAELRAAARNKLLSPKQREDILNKALKIEQDNAAANQKLAEDQYKKTFVQVQRRAKLNDDEVKKFAANRVEFATELLNSGRIEQQHLDAVFQAEEGLLKVRQDSNAKQNKLQNEIDKNDLAAQAKADAAAAKKEQLDAKEAARKEKEKQAEIQFQQEMQDIRFRNIEIAAANEAKGIDLEKAARDKANADLLKATEETADTFIDTTKKTNELVAKINKDTREAQIKATKEFLLDNIGAVTGSIFSIIQSGFDRQKNALQDQIDKSEELKNAEIDRITSSAASEEEKAARIAVVNAKAQADRERLEKKQRELDKKKAIADKQKAVFDIIINTAIAVVKALPNIFLAVATGVIGAAQLAAVLAQPIPKFAKGTNYSPEGFAYVGEQGSEVIETPSGKRLLTPSRATLTYLERGSKVIPNNKLNSMALDGLAGVSRFTTNSTNDFQVLAKATNESAERITKAIKGQSGTIITEGGLYQQHLKAAKLANYIKRNLR